MLLVIFGAGASYDACPSWSSDQNRDGRVPLADDLFDRSLEGIAVRHSGMADILPLLRDRIGDETVEGALEDFRLDAGDDVERQRQLVAVRFYIHHVIASRQVEFLRRSAGVSNYKTLFDELRRLVPPEEAIAIVNFNYDTLVEAALVTRSVAIDDLLAYVAGPRWKLFKVHGSISWARQSNLLNPRVEERLIVVAPHGAQSTIDNLAPILDPKQVYKEDHGFTPYVLGRFVKLDLAT